MIVKIANKSYILSTAFSVMLSYRKLFGISAIEAREPWQLAGLLWCASGRRCDFFKFEKSALLDEKFLLTAFNYKAALLECREPSIETNSTTSLDKKQIDAEDFELGVLRIISQSKLPESVIYECSAGDILNLLPKPEKKYVMMSDDEVSAMYSR